MSGSGRRTGTHCPKGYDQKPKAGVAFRRIREVAQWRPAGILMAPRLAKSSRAVRIFVRPITASATGRRRGIRSRSIRRRAMSASDASSDPSRLWPTFSNRMRLPVAAKDLDRRSNGNKRFGFTLRQSHMRGFANRSRRQTGARQHVCYGFKLRANSDTIIMIWPTAEMVGCRSIRSLTGRSKALLIKAWVVRREWVPELVQNGCTRF